MKLLTERREQELRLVWLRRVPVLDPVQRAVNEFDDRNRHGACRQRECDGSDIQAADHDLTTLAVRSNARSSSATTITAPEMASASRMAGTYSASVMVGEFLRFVGVWEWEARRVRAGARRSQSILTQIDPLPRWRVFARNWL